MLRRNWPVAKRLGGADVAAKIREEVRSTAELCRERGVNPTLAIIRAGARPDDLAYEKRVKSNCEKAALDVKVFEAEADVSQADFEALVRKVGSDDGVHGILVFRPLPESLDEERIAGLIPLEKDVDCMNPESLSGVFLGNDAGFAPCTPEAVIEILDFYGVETEGAGAVVVNRSMVLGKPLSQLLLKKNATVTVCHSRTRNLAELTGNADIVITGVGRPGYFGPEFFSPKNTVIDVGINFREGKMCGDADYDGASEIVEAITPVPGGVGAVTSMILLKHTAQAALRSTDE